MTSDRGLTGNPPVNILTMSEINSHTFKARSDDLAIAQLIKNVQRGFDGYATILRSVFWNSCESVPLDK
jgi:hypothetical protein